MKPFKSLADQHELLKNRGLSIEETDNCEQYLLMNNYYTVINGYSKFFSSNGDTFIPGTTFEEITKVHYFDKEVKTVLFNYITESERRFKSVVAHKFSEAHADDPYAYLKTSSYDQRNLLEVAKVTAMLSKVIEYYRRLKHVNPIKHYSNNHNDVPLWVLMGYLTFGQVVKIYSSLKGSLKNSIARELSFFLKDNLGEPVILQPEALEPFLLNLVEVRNIVAHNNNLFNHKYRYHTKYSLKLHRKYNIGKEDPRQDVYNVFLYMQCLLNRNQYAKLHNTLLKRTTILSKSINTISCNEIITSMGFPVNWHEITDKLPQD